MPTPWPDPGLATPADLAACRELLRGGSRSFFAASLLLPPSVRAPAAALYAFCRIADDAVDLGSGGPHTLARLHERLDRAYAGRPFPDPVDRALADVVAAFGIPRTLLDALLEGFAWDAAGRAYEDLGELCAYGARVAGTVGVMMTLLMEVRRPEVAARACEMGMAMQLTNIARDVGEDARAGRLYLPRGWLRDAGIDPDAWLAAPVFSAALATVVQRVLQAAEVLYERGRGGIAALPPSCRPGVHAAGLLYAEIGNVLARGGLDSVTRRTIVPLSRKAVLLARAATTRPLPALAAPPVPEARFLIEAVAAASALKPYSVGSMAEDAPWWDLEGRLRWVIDLFERLERRQVGRFGGGALVEGSRSAAP